jgi:hypothetical protein
VENQLGKAELDGDLPRFFLGQAIRIGSREGFNQRALAVIDVTGSRENEMLFDHVSF